MKKILTCFILLIVNKVVLAQNVSGTVTDGQNHQLLSYSTVSLINPEDSSHVKAGLANENGRFKLENIKAGSYLLSAEMIGYSKKNIPVILTKGEVVVDIVLLPETKVLGEITIRSSKPLVEHHADKLIFNTANSIIAAGNNGMELLKMAPLVTSGPNDAIKLKGKDNVMIMLDGKIVPPQTVGSLLQSMSAEQIAKIEIITNPSSKYDASASGGLINIITKKGTGTGFNGTANFTASRSSFGKYNGGITANYRNDKVNIYGNLNLRDGKGYRNEHMLRYMHAAEQQITLETPTELFTHTKAQTGKVGLELVLNKASSLSFSGEGLFSQNDNRVNATSNFRSAGGTIDSVLTSDSRPGRNNEYTAFDAYYKNKFSANGAELVIDLNHSHFTNVTSQALNTAMRIAPSDVVTGYGTSVNRTNALFNISTFQTDYSLPLDTNTTLDAGIKEINTRSSNQSFNENIYPIADAPNLSNTSYKENIAAAYVTLTKQINTLRIQGGLRSEKTNARLSNTDLDTKYLDFFPSALIDKKFCDWYDLTLSYTSKVNRPVYEALIPFVIPIDRYTQEKGNPNLKPEYVQSFELTNNIHRISVTMGYSYTRNVITDFIQQDQQTKVWTFMKGNFSRLENYSLALIIPYQITDWWSGNNTLTGLHNFYLGDDVGGSIYNHGRFSYNLYSVNTFLLPIDIKGELTAMYNSASVDGLYQISHYSMVNAGISRSFLNKNLNVKIGADDIFKGTGYSLITNSGSLHLNAHNYTDSRRISLSLSYKFGAKTSPTLQREHHDIKDRLNL